MRHEVYYKAMEGEYIETWRKIWRSSWIKDKGESLGCNVHEESKWRSWEFKRDGKDDERFNIYPTRG